MTRGTQVNPPLRRAALLLAFLPFLFFVAGCEPDAYPSQLKYSLRKDLLVTDPGGSMYPQTFGPGQLDKWLQARPKEDSTFKAINPSGLSASVREKLAADLEERFGTPAQPAVHFLSDDRKALQEEYRDNQDLVSATIAYRATLVLDEDTLARGSVLYRRHCLHCHGVAGDGRGPTAPWVNPPPRDYRRGLFKFKSTAGYDTRISRADLRRTLHEGVEGTSMPNFQYMPSKDLEALVSYVIHLSIRGEVEYEVTRALLTPQSDEKDQQIHRPYAVVLAKWIDVKPLSEKADGAADKIFPYPKGLPIELTSETSESQTQALRDSIRKGRDLYFKNGCTQCHTDFGRQAQFRHDVWGTLVRPANLTEGVYRGGRRPIDLYYRIHSGIKPSGMQAVGPVLGEDIWHLVNYVRFMPYPNMLPQDVRDQLYRER